MFQPIGAPAKLRSDVRVLKIGLMKAEVKFTELALRGQTCGRVPGGVTCCVRVLSVGLAW